MNKKAQAAEITLRELIVGFGFLEGLWLAVGINPEAEVISAFTGMLVELQASAGYIILLKILPIIAVIGTLVLIYHLGGKLGLVAVGCAFLGGVLILVSPIISIILILIALGLGSIATE
jgi:hypothetical protein